MGWTSDDEVQEEEQTDDDESEETADENEGETVENEDEAMSEESEFDASSLAPSAMDVTEASEKEPRHTMLCWANEGEGKTHMGYTFPEPVCIIDTEHKADDIAHKFDDKEVYIWQPEDFDEACDHRDEALNFLSEYKAQTGQRGTIFVDSMADMWDWSQYKFIDEWYPNTPPDDVNIELQDWPKIKDYHNKTWRKPMESCDFHVYWTSTRKDDVGAVIQNDDVQEAPDKPGGESTNAYKVNSILRLYLNSNGVPVGDLQKSGLTRFKYIGLKRPTFEKHMDVLEEIQRIEAEGVDNVGDVRSAYSLEYDVEFTEANTMRFIE